MSPIARLRRLVPALSPLTVVLTVACGGYGSAYHGSTSIAEATCEAAFSCASAWPDDAEGSFEEQYGASEDACVSRLGPDPAQQDAWDAAEESGTLVYTKEAAKDCAVDVRAQPCPEFFDEPAPDRCAAAVVGTLELDAECSLDAVCASGLCQDGRCAGQPDPGDADDADDGEEG